MIDFRSSMPINQSFQCRSKMQTISSQPFLFSARPKIQDLPFLNNLKSARKLLVALKNQKLRKSLYVFTEGYCASQKQGNQIFKHEKAKLSVMDLISEEGKFQQLQNTIKSGLNKQQISPVTKIQIQLPNNKQQLKEFKTEQSNKPLKENSFGNQNNHKKMNQEPQQKQKQRQKQKPSILQRKNRLASQLNKLGHELEQTYFQVEEMQNVFYTLCNFYAENKKIVQKNLKLKEEKDVLRVQIQDFKFKIRDNQREQISLKDKFEEFETWYKQSTKSYVKDVIEFNRQIQPVNSLSQSSSQMFLPYPSSSQEQLLCITKKQQPSSQLNQQLKLHQSLKVKLKFKSIKSELEKIKADRKSNAQTKNNQKKQKNQSNQFNSSNKLFVSELYSL